MKRRFPTNWPDERETESLAMASINGIVVNDGVTGWELDSAKQVLVPPTAEKTGTGSVC